ncbi:phospholipase effector Tle1 domain-containing protein [Pseudomonas sp. NPDC089401]|uniref:phospholipase effector Tle1 domain-containing protein n=1 Tax=Pseudomonas sp. NPDC089401 TaxID=3364462 RepID=UPI0037FA7950
MTTQNNPVRVGIFFDGTGNHQGNSGQANGELTGSYANARSNIALLHALYPEGPVGDQAFIKLYIEGVGTREGAPDSLYAMATGRGAAGVEARVAQALSRAAEQLRQHGSPARIEFDLFGFSRGAASARHLANRLGGNERGMPAQLQGVRGINFIGLFDTVAAIVEPLVGDFDPADARHCNLRLGLEAGIARQVVQLVAGDERRHNFALIRSGNDIVVPGAHADIGGGYPLSMREQVLLSKPRSSRERQATPPERSEAYAQAKALLADLGEPRSRVLAWEVPVGNGRAQRDDAQKLVYAAVYREREVSGHLSRVYLSIMRELGVRAGVPFMPLGGDEAHGLPGELQGISGKLHAYVLGAGQALQLSAAEDALLRGKYVHASAHWNALKGLRGSGLDSLYVNRPGQGGRVVHDNPV